MPDRDLDARIRELVARAAADAPAPPELDAEVPLRTPGSPRHDGHRGWWIGGGAAVLAAAAVVTAFVMVARSGEHITTANTTPPVAPATTAAPPATAPSPTTSTSPAPTTTVAPANPIPLPAPTTTAAVLVAPTPPPNPPASTTTVAATGGVLMATAGADGVRVLDGGVEVRHLDQPAQIALLTPGGAVIFQAAPATPDGAVGDPTIWRPDGTVEALLGPLPEQQHYRLYDLAAIDGVPTLLYGVQHQGADAGSATAPEDFFEVVNALAMAPGGWTTTEVTTMNTWEAGFSRLALTDRGLVVGTTHQEASHALFAMAVPGSPADDGTRQLDPARFGLQSDYGDCGDCPRDFTISTDGESLVWTHGADLVVADTSSGSTRRWTVPSLATVPFLSSLDVRTSSDGGVEAAISFGLDVSSAIPTPVVVSTSPPGGVVETPVSGQLATFGP